VPLLNLTPSAWFTLLLFCAMALLASLRSTTASTLGLDQLPGQPGAMMGGAHGQRPARLHDRSAAGGAVLALVDFGALGVLIARVSERSGRAHLPGRG
jgi:hypothetical protein